MFWVTLVGLVVSHVAVGIASYKYGSKVALKVAEAKAKAAEVKADIKAIM